MDTLGFDVGVLLAVGRVAGGKSTEPGVRDSDGRVRSQDFCHSFAQISSDGDG